MRASMAFLLAFALPTAAVAAQGRTTLDIYVTDVEGGNGTLFVTPSGESVLIDTGNANGAVRDVRHQQRMHAASNPKPRCRRGKVGFRRSAEARDSTDGLPLTVRERSFVLGPPDGKVCP